jgi:alkylation response protein AidB-like acyl-CoA dehydrogenase
MTTTATSLPTKKGMSYLTEETAPNQIFTREDLSEEHRAVAQTVDDFWAREVEPNLPAIRDKKPGVALEIVRKSAELGLTGISIPEQFGGMEMDLASTMLVAEHIGRDASYAGWHSAHTGIGTLPILFFGTPRQKEKYLPKLVKVEMLAAYALTEPLAGSDAMAARTRADLTPDGKHYVLNGQKMWITNGGEADLFTVFAKVGGEKLTAFLVERAFGGVTSGAEEKKMGIKGSSTTAVYFENVPVPAANVLGEIGRGHIIAFNILNIGRLKLGTLAVAGAKRVLELSIRYAKERKAFGSAIAEFGAIQHKLAEMAIRIYAAESMAWRTVGLIQGASGSTLKSIEEYAVECSMVKVYGSEVFDYAADEGVQIHGGYGFHQDYEVEKWYRDSRINRIFEGTNEINRLLISGMLLKRAARGQLSLKPAATEPPPDEEARLIQDAKCIALRMLGLALERYGPALEKQQEVLMDLADIIMEVFAMESSWLRARKTGAAADMCAVFLRDALTRIEQSARGVLGACAEGEELRAHMAALRQLAAYDPLNTVALRRKVAERLLARGRY